MLLLVLAWKRSCDRISSRASRQLAVAADPAHARASALPIGAQQALEAGAFGAIGLLMGVLGTIEMAAHQIAITLAALTFMVPLGVATAAAVRVGHAIGAGDDARARAAIRAAYVCGVGFMTHHGGRVSDDAASLRARVHATTRASIALAAVLIPIAGVFQVFDGAQAVGAGVLRGAGDTTAPLLVMLGVVLARRRAGERVSRFRTSAAARRDCGGASWSSLARGGDRFCF